MGRKPRNKKQNETKGSQDPSDSTHRSSNARHKLFYTKRTAINKKEERILKTAHNPASYKLYFLYYVVGVSAFMTWAAFGRLGLLFGIIGMAYVFYRFVRMNWSFETRITYEREYPVKTITDIHKEHANDGLRLSAYSIVLTLIILIAKNTLAI